MRSVLPLLLVISSAGFISRPARALHSNPKFQQSAPQSATKTAVDHPHHAPNPAPAAGGNRQKHGNPSNEKQRPRQLSGRNPERGAATLQKVRPRQIQNASGRFTSTKPGNSHQPGNSKTGRAEKGASIKQEGGNSARPVQSPNATRPALPPQSNVRHRGANPAVIGGSANFGVRNTGAINGTSVRRKP